MSLLSIASDKGLSKTGFYSYEINEMLQDDFHAELIILGNSRAEVQIATDIIDSVFDINSYNMGLLGCDMIAQKTRYDLVAEKHKTQYLIYCVDDHSLVESIGLPHLTSYYPYLSNLIVKKMVKEYDVLHWYDFYNPFTKYLFQPQMLTGLLEFANVRHFSSGKQKGYWPQNIPWNEEGFDIFKKENPDGITDNFSEKCFTTFDNFLSERTPESKIVLVFTPQYIEGQEIIKNRNVAIDFYQKMSDKYQIPFFDYSTDSICLNKSYFYNAMHLNKQGSELFTLKLALQLKEMKFIE